MIIIEIRLLTPEGVKFDGEEPATMLDIADTDDMSFAAPVKYDLKASLVSGGVLVEGWVRTRIAGRCGRCLERFEADVTATDICHYYENVNGPELDVTEDIREDLVLMLPANPLCGDDCLGLCPECGANRNRKSCRCRDKAPSNPAWSGLDDLKFEK
jgi:uncharacterized protein